MLFMKWSSGFYHFPQVFIFTCKNSSVKTHAGIEFVLSPYLLVVKNNSFGQSFECDYTKSDVPSHSKMIDWLSTVLCRAQNFFWVWKSTGERLQRLYALRESLPCGTGWRQRNSTFLNVTGSAISYSGSNEKQWKRQIFWTRQHYITLH